MDLHSHCALIEDGLAVLENLGARADLARAKLDKEQQLVNYKLSKKKLVAQYSGKSYCS